jgi:hypothetical protein
MQEIPPLPTDGQLAHLTNAIQLRIVLISRDLSEAGAAQFGLTRAAWAKRLRVTERTITRALRALQRAGVFARAGLRCLFTWATPKPQNPEPQEAPDGDPESSPPLSPYAANARARWCSAFVDGMVRQGAPRRDIEEPDDQEWIDRESYELAKSEHEDRAQVCRTMGEAYRAIKNQPALAAAGWPPGWGWLRNARAVILEGAKARIKAEHERRDAMRAALAPPPDPARAGVVLGARELLEALKPLGFGK